MSGMVVLEILKVIVRVTFLFQYIYLFIIRSYNDPVRRFSNKGWSLLTG